MEEDRGLCEVFVLFFFFFNMCVLFLNTKVGKQRFVFVGTPAKFPESRQLCPQQCRLK